MQLTDGRRQTHPRLVPETPSPPAVLTFACLSPAERAAEAEPYVSPDLLARLDDELFLRIRDERLYRETHGSFEDYCRGRWGLSRPHAYRLMDAAATTEVSSPMGDVPSERVARELAPLRSEPDVLREAWVETVERHGPEPTAAQTREVVRRRQAPPIVPLEPRTGDGLSQAANSGLAHFHAMIAVIAGLGDDHLDGDLSTAPAEWQAEIRRDCLRAARALSRLGRKP